jgi:hypothetical protein
MELSNQINTSNLSSQENIADNYLYKTTTNGDTYIIKDASEQNLSTDISNDPIIGNKISQKFIIDAAVIFMESINEHKAEMSKSYYQPYNYYNNNSSTDGFKILSNTFVKLMDKYTSPAIMEDAKNKYLEEQLKLQEELGKKIDSYPTIYI